MSARSRAALLPLAAIWLLVACSDGYPEKSDTAMLHYGMGQAEAMETMNRIGQSKQRGNPTRFALLEGCALEVHARRPTDGRESRILPLRGTQASMDKLADSDAYRVSLEQTRSGKPAPVVIEGIPWAEATQMKWLLDYVQSTC
jgi:hypothetical protein